MKKKIAIEHISLELCQNIYNRLEPYEQRNFMADNISDVSDDLIKDEYDTRDLCNLYDDTPSEDSYEEGTLDDIPKYMSPEQLFDNLQEILYANNKTRYDMPMSLEKALDTVRDMYSYNNAH